MFTSLEQMAQSRGGGGGGGGQGGNKGSGVRSANIYLMNLVDS